MVRETTYHAGGKMASFAFCWDMQTHESITVPHLLDFDKIILLGSEPITITITNDAQNEFTGLGIGGGGFTIGKRAFDLWRPNGGQFHGPKFKDPGVTRGYIVVLYKNIPT